MLLWGRAFSSQRRGGWSEEWGSFLHGYVPTRPSLYQAAPPAVQQGVAGDRGDADNMMVSVLHVVETPAPQNMCVMRAGAEAYGLLLRISFHTAGGGLC